SMLTPRRRCAVLRAARFADLMALLPTSRDTLSEDWRHPSAVPPPRQLSARPSRRLRKDALNVAYHGLALEAGDDLGQVIEVPHLELDQDLGEILHPSRHAQIIDVAIRLANNLRDLGQRP